VKSGPYVLCSSTARVKPLDVHFQNGIITGFYIIILIDLFLSAISSKVLLDDVMHHDYASSSSM
jgi:hypothetical protein